MLQAKRVSIFGLLAIRPQWTLGTEERSSGFQYSNDIWRIGKVVKAQY